MEKKKKIIDRRTDARTAISSWEIVDRLLVGWFVGFPLFWVYGRPEDNTNISLFIIYNSYWVGGIRKKWRVPLNYLIHSKNGRTFIPLVPSIFNTWVPVCPSLSRQFEFSCNRKMTSWQFVTSLRLSNLTMYISFNTVKTSLTFRQPQWYGPTIKEPERTVQGYPSITE